MNPAIAPVADAVMQGANWQAPTPGGDDPGFDQIALDAPGPVTNAAMSDTAGAAAQAQSQQQAQAAEGDGPGAVEQNTSPAFPPVPQQPASGQNGIETLTPADNLETV